MTSFAYTVWINKSVKQLVDQLSFVFGEMGYFLKNPNTGKTNFWNTDGEDVEYIDLDRVDFPIGLQWWRKEMDDIYVGIREVDVAGVVSDITLVGLSIKEKAEIAKLLIVNFIPDKQCFPQDFDVFRLSA